MADEPGEAVTRAWARLVRARDLALAAIEAEFRAAGLPPLGWYDVLLELAREGAPLRPGTLETRLLLAQHNVSRLLDRMEKAGLLARAPCASDGRGQEVSLTDAGSEMQRQMWAVYGPAIQHHIGAPLGEEGAARLAEGLGRIIDSARGG
jgi:DNA-binding MarR family transcriptional regulator